MVNLQKTEGKTFKEYGYLIGFYLFVFFSGEQICKKASILFGIQFDKKRYEDLVKLLNTITVYKDLVRVFQYFLHFPLRRYFF